jgi:phosphoglycerate dehydrogenase-like enzyme
MNTALVERITAVSSRVRVQHLRRMQRYVYRDGRPLWAGYNEPPDPGDESEEDARSSLADVLQRTDVLLTNPIVPDDILDRAPNLAWLQLTSAGVDRLLDSEPVRSDRVQVTTASGLHAVPISEWVLGAMIAFAKGFPRAIDAQREQTWRPFWPQELEGATVAVVGLGAIGSRVAQLAKALGMRVLGVRRSAPARLTAVQASDPRVDELFPAADLAYALAEADYVVLAVPLTDDTRALIGEAELRAMKPGAVIVNIARGAVIDQAALVRALREGWIAGAALDVTDPEPLPPDDELWKAPNVMITPHISGGTPRYMDRAVDIFCENLERYLAGKPLRNVVDPARGY